MSDDISNKPARLDPALLDRVEALANWLDSSKPRSWVIPNFWSCRSADLRALVAWARGVTNDV